MKKLILSALFAISGMMAYQASAQNYQYWDNNGSSPSTSGTWDTTSSFWANNGALSATPGTFTNGNFAVFSAGTAGILNMTITVPGPVTCEGIGDGEDPSGATGTAVTNLTFTGVGPITLAAGSWSIDCGNSAPSPNIVINVPITGTGGIIQHNSGSLYLYGNNSYSGGTSATGGQIIYYNNDNSFGAGPIATSGGGTSFWCTNDPNDIVTLPNAWTVSSGTTVINFVNGDTICSGPWTLGASMEIKNSSAPTTNVTISGTISGAYGLDFATPNGGTIILSGPNTYTGGTTDALAGATATLSVSSINSVTTPAQQASSSLGKPSSAANGRIQLGTAGYGGTLIYTGPGETSDRVINLASTTGHDTIEMDGAGPLIFSSPFAATGAGAKTLTLQGSSTAANTIEGAISNNSSSDTTALTKAGTGNWVLSGTNRFTGGLTISAGTLTIGGAGDLNGGSYAGAISDAATFIYGSTAGQTLSGAISGAGAFNIAAQAGTSVTISGTANSFTGLWTVTSGTFSIDGDGSLGTAPGSIVANAITLNGGPAASLRANANNIIINANRGLYLGASGGSIQVAGNDTCTYNGIISGSGPFQNGQNSSTGLGILVLGGSESYTNTTVLAAGTLRLSASGSLGNSSGILMSNSPTLDVSAQSPFSLSTTNTFTVISGGTTTATILGPSGGNVDFGSQTVNLSFLPSLADGDPSNILTISQSALVLNGNTINVTNASALTLDVGNYALILCTNGISLTSPTLNYFGPIAANTTSNLVVVGNTLVLQIAPATGYANSQFSNLTPSQSVTYGAAATLSGTVSAAGPTYPNLGETVTITIPNEATNTATISDNTGDFTFTTPTTVPVGTYVINYSYPGTNSTLAPATDTSTTLTITKAPATVTATDQIKTYGQTLVTNASTAFTTTGLQNGEIIGTVTLAVSGSPAGSVSNAPVSGSPYAITPSAATGGTFLAGNYSITYVSGALTVNPLPVGLSGTRVYDGTATADYSILSITNIVGSDVVSLASGSATLAASAVGVEPITSATGLTLTGAASGNYTTTGATGAVTVTNPYLPFSILSIQVVNNNAVVVFQSVPGVTYQMLSSSDVSLPFTSWTAAGAPIIAGDVTATNIVPVSGTNEFFIIQN